MRGRPKLPAKIHRDRGTFQPSRHGGTEPDVEIPPTPKNMSDQAKETWDAVTEELEALGLICKIDQIAMRLLCDSFGTYMSAQQHINEHGVTVMHKKWGRDGDIENIVENPSIKVRDTAFTQIHRMLREFGMTPSARVGLKPSNAAPQGSDILGFLGLN